jgi:hypothetical protein
MYMQLTCNSVLLTIHSCRQCRFSRALWYVHATDMQLCTALNSLVQAVQIFNSPVALGLVRTQHRTLYATNIGISRCAAAAAAAAAGAMLLCCVG